MARSLSAYLLSQVRMDSVYRILAFDYSDGDVGCCDAEDDGGQVPGFPKRTSPTVPMTTLVVALHLQAVNLEGSRILDRINSASKVQRLCLPGLFD